MGADDVVARTHASYQWANLGISKDMEIDSNLHAKVRELWMALKDTAGGPCLDEATRNVEGTNPPVADFIPWKVPELRGHRDCRGPTRALVHEAERKEDGSLSWHQIVESDMRNGALTRDPLWSVVCIVCVRGLLDAMGMLKSEAAAAGSAHVLLNESSMRAFVCALVGLTIRNDRQGIHLRGIWGDRRGVHVAEMEMAALCAALACNPFAHRLSLDVWMDEAGPQPEPEKSRPRLRHLQHLPMLLRSSTLQDLLLSVRLEAAVADSDDVPPGDHSDVATNVGRSSSPASATPVILTLKGLKSSTPQAAPAHVADESNTSLRKLYIQIVTMDEELASVSKPISAQLDEILAMACHLRALCKLQVKSHVHGKVHLEWGVET